MLHNRLGQAARRVVRARRTAVTALCDIDRTRRDDHKVAEGVLAQQARVGQHALEDLLPVIAGLHQAAALLLLLQSLGPPLT